MSIYIVKTISICKQVHGKLKELHYPVMVEVNKLILNYPL